MNVFEKLNNALLLSALALSLLLHVVIAVSIFNVKIPEQVTKRDFEKWVKSVQPVRPKGVVLKKAPMPVLNQATKPAAEEPKVAASEPVAAPKKVDSAPAPAPGSKQANSAPQAGASQQSGKVRSKLASSGVLGLIGVASESRSKKGKVSAVADVFSSSSGSLDENLGSAMQGKRSLGVASGSGFSKGSLKGSGNALNSTADIDSVGNSSSGKIAVAQRKDADVPVPRVSSGASSVTTGSADQAGVLAVLAKKNSSFTRCYEKALKNIPDLSGKLSYQMSVAADGTVFDVQFTQDTVRSPDVLDCIRSILLRLVFPAPKGGPAIFSSVLVFGTT